MCHLFVETSIYNIGIIYSFQELRRDLQAVIGTRANINIAQIENYGGETFLSEELAITLLQETKNAFQRCQLVCYLLLQHVILFTNENYSYQDQKKKPIMQL